MRMVEWLRARVEARFDSELENYLQAWIRTVDRCDDELQRVMLGIATRAAGQGGVRGCYGLAGAPAYDLFTRILIGIEESLAQLIRAHPRDVWLIRSRHHLICDLLSQPPASNFEVRGRMSAYQHVPRALAVFAPAGDTDRSDSDVLGSRRVPDTMPAEVHVLVMLLEWYALCQLFRRRIVLGGEVVPDHSLLRDVDLPGAELPPAPAAELPTMLVREERLASTSQSSDLLANVGLNVPIQRFPNFGTAQVDFAGAAQFTYFFLAGVHPVEAFQIGTRQLSRARIFGQSWLDARDLLEPLEYLQDEIVQTWDMSPLEVVAGATTLCLFVRDVWAADEEPGQFDRSFRTRALVTTRSHELEDYLEAELPAVTAALGGRLESGGVVAAARKALRQFVEVPRQQPPPRDGPQLRMYGPTPFLTRDGDRSVIDLYSMFLAFSSLVATTPFTGSRVQQKGRWFEDAVRRFLVGSDATISSVPTMEQEFRVRRTTVGEADVVVRVADTAFVIECKSRRASKTDDCVTLDEALHRSRDVAVWAAQARRTAEYLAANPHGPQHDVPAGVEWIIPVVCSQLLEADWREHAGTYLIPGELTMFMTPGEVLDFVLGDRWRSRSAREWQYAVVR